MSLDSETILQLTSFGLTEYQARVYLALTLKGPQKASALALASGIPRPHIYSALKVLEERGFIIPIPKKVVEYRAQPIEEALKKALDDRKQSIAKLEEIGKYLSEKFDKGMDTDVERSGLIKIYRGPANVRNGLRNIFSKIKKRCDFLTNHQSDAYLGGRVYDKDVFALFKVGVEMRGLVPVDKNNIDMIEKLSSFVSVRHIGDSILEDSALSASNMGQYTRMRIIIVDGEEVMYVLANQDDTDEYAIHSRQKDMVLATSLVYDQIWNNAPGLAIKKMEIKRGVKPGSTAILAGDKEYQTIARGIVSRAGVFAYGALSQEQLIYNLTAATANARELTSRGVKIKVIVDVKSDISADLKVIKDTDAEIRHMSCGKMPMMFLNEGEAIVEMIDSELTGSVGDIISAYISDPAGVSRLISFFEKEWARSQNIHERIKEIRDADHRP